MNWLTAALVFAEVEPKELDPEQRARLLMAMTGLALTGVLVLLLVVLGAWSVRRIIHRRRARPSLFAGHSNAVQSLAAVLDAQRGLSDPTVINASAVGRPNAEPSEFEGYRAEDAYRAAEANLSPADRRDLMRLRSNQPGLGPADPR
ncbi:MAG TPA: hypothetical protein VGE52_08965 [Pirellulales bacterium]